jgi:hypothetical protein
MFDWMKINYGPEGEGAGGATEAPPAAPSSEAAGESGEATVAALSDDDWADLMSALPADLDSTTKDEPAVVAADGPKEAGEAQLREPAKDEGGTGAGTKPQAAPAPAAVVPESAPQADSQLAALQQQNQQLLDVIKTLNAGQRQPSQERGASPTPARQVQFDIPDDVVANVVADDPQARKKALFDMQQLMFQTVMAEFSSGASQLMANDIPALVRREIAVKEVSGKWSTDFYSFYPQLGRTTQLRNVAANAAVSVAKRSGWDGQMSKPFADAVAAETLRMLGIKPGQRAPQAPAAAPKAPTLSGGASAAKRPNGTLDPNSPGGIADILGDM